MSRGREVVVAGTGLVCTLGTDPIRAVDVLLAGGVPPSDAALLDAARPRAPYFPAAGLRAARGAERLTEMLDLAVGQALEAAAGVDRSRLAVFVGSTSKDIGVSEALYRDGLGAGRSPVPLELSGYGNIAALAAERFGLAGQRYTFHTACASSADALLYAMEMIHARQLDQAIVIGAELANTISLSGFSGLLLLAQARMRPFDRRRDGVILGEAVGAVVLARRGTLAPAPGYEGVSYLGGAALCDTLSLTASSAEGTARTMREALARAGLAAGDVGLVKIHGTATGVNDLAEGRGMRDVFGKRVPPFTSVKSATGHTLGACGVVELVLMFEALRRGRVPATVGFETADDELGIQPLAVSAPDPGGPVMLNYFGFGGSNTSLLFAREARA